MMVGNDDVVAIEEFDPSSYAAASITHEWLAVPIGLDAGLELPVITVRGARSGPTAMFVAGVHGDEFEGVAALASFADRLDVEELSGTVIALPTCNRWAFSAQLRTTPALIDGANLARSFPGDPAGGPTARLASALSGLVTQLLGPQDLMVDLHSAGTRYRYLMLAGFRHIEGPARAASEAAARAFAAGSDAQLWLIPDGSGMFNAETTRAGIPTIGTEAPGQGECRATDVHRYQEGLLNLLRHQQMVPGNVAFRDLNAARMPYELLAPVDGILVSSCEVGQLVAEGEPLAKIIDSHGNTRAELRASRPGEIWALRSFASIYRGELVAWIA